MTIWDAVRLRDSLRNEGRERAWRGRPGRCRSRASTWHRSWRQMLMLTQNRRFSTDGARKWASSLASGDDCVAAEKDEGHGCFLARCCRSHNGISHTSTQENSPSSIRCAQCSPQKLIQPEPQSHIRLRTATGQQLPEHPQRNKRSPRERQICVIPGTRRKRLLNLVSSALALRPAGDGWSTLTGEMPYEYASVDFWNTTG